MFIDKSMTRIVITIEPEASILDASTKMKKYDIHHLPVVQEDKTLVGIVTDRDVRTALPSPFLQREQSTTDSDRIAKLKIKDIMTRDPVTVSPANTLEDALLLMQKVNVGAFPVIDQTKKLIGIITVRDLMRVFIKVLGLHEPGTLLCILAENKLGTMKRIVDAIGEERIPFGSILVARTWEEGKRAVFPYLLTSNIAHIKKKLEKLGFELLNPMEWCLDELPERDAPDKQLTDH